MTDRPNPFVGHTAITAKQAEQLTNGDLSAEAVRRAARKRTIRPTRASGDRNRRFLVADLLKLLEPR